MLAGWDHIRASKPALSSTKGNWRRSRQLDSVRTSLPILTTASDLRTRRALAGGEHAGVIAVRPWRGRGRAQFWPRPRLGPPEGMLYKAPTFGKRARQRPTSTDHRARPPAVPARRVPVQADVPAARPRWAGMDSPATPPLDADPLRAGRATAPELQAKSSHKHLGTLAGASGSARRPPPALPPNATPNPTPPC